MRTFGLITSAGTRESFRWPMDDLAGGTGALPTIAGLRSWGSSMTGGFDDRMGPETTATRLSDRIAGVLGLAPHAVKNEGIFGSDIMDSSSVGIGFGRVLRLIKPHSTYQEWPWEPHGRYLEHFWWGINGIGAGSYRNTGFYWPTQASMWQTVWVNDWRSVIQRCIAGAIYYPLDSLGTSPVIWRNVNAGTNQLGSGPLPSMASTPAFAFLGPAAGGASHWTYRADTSVSTNGYWHTDQQGDRITIKVPVDYDTGTIAIRHLCPGSWFDGPVVTTGGTGVAGSGANQIGIRTGAEHVRSPSAVTVSATGMTTQVVDCRGLANRIHFATSSTSNPGAGNLGVEGAMSHVSRHALPPTPGTQQTVTLTVTTLPAGGWYGFDSWEIEAVPAMRPLVCINNVPDPASWANTTYLFAESLWPLLSASAQRYSDALVTLVDSYLDPGIMVADARSKTALHQTSHAIVYDGDVTAPDGWPDGYPVELSSRSTYSPSGDGLHGHAIHEHDVIEATFEALAAAAPLIGRGRGALPFTPGRSLGQV